MKNVFLSVLRMILLSSLAFPALLLTSCEKAVLYSQSSQQAQNGMVLKTEDGLNVKVQFYADDIVRIVKWLSEGTEEKKSLIVIQDHLPKLDLRFEEESDTVSITSGKLTVRLFNANGRIQYLDSSGRTILNENGQIITPIDIPYEENAFSVQQNFKLSPEEGIYGLGQHQAGYMNYRGHKLLLVQSNTDAVASMLISTRKYGILWDNTSMTRFEDNDINMSLWSDVGDNIDYYFIAGQTMDDVIAGYRDLTGQTPMYGKWAYGYWQSREHYKTQEEVLGIARQYRQRETPIDNIVQDWNYWGGNENWSGMVFDKNKYPDPKGMMDTLHEDNFHLMISIWPALGPGSEIHKEMDNKGFLYDQFGWAGFKYYDAFNPQANQLYWEYLKKELYAAGIDGWWIDSTEPDVVNALTKEATEYEMKRIGFNYLGSWARYLNAFSLSMTDALYQNLRNESQEQRAYILTRSTFSGQQRNAATTWSGDIGANWDVYKKQIAAGVNHCMSGIPYWTFDIGAFVIGSYGGVFSNGGKDPAYQELYSRMFQFGAFCPIFRAHGSETPREIWEFGEFTEGMINIDNLRYRLMPYIYSLAWQVTDQGYTIMRGLPMDFPDDTNTYSIDNQFMFGPALMVCPVVEYQKYRPPEDSILITPEHFKTPDGKPGLLASYFNDGEFKDLIRQQIEPNIDLFWYTGWPDYITDPVFSIRWEGKLTPTQIGMHRFHMKSFGPKHIYLDDQELDVNYRSVEFYTVPVELEAGREYDFKFETGNAVAGAFRSRVFWKTPEIHAKEKMANEQRKMTRSVYFPDGGKWFDFWTGRVFDGGQTLEVDAPMDKIPLLVRAGSIVPMGPFIQYSSEKCADPIELRIYSGADGSFVLYEDENDNYNYEKGVYVTIAFGWDDAKRQLTIDDRKGRFPGMLTDRTFHVVIVKEGQGTGVEVTNNPDQIIRYNGKKHVINF